VSSTLVALGFIGQISDVGDTFKGFALTALPTLYILGLFTFIRVVENGVEDMMLGRAINRIRHYYLELAGEQRRLFMLSGHDDALGVIRNMGDQPVAAAAVLHHRTHDCGDQQRRRGRSRRD
jgi:hypothetical protein